jgi:folylpolyglutamate synthase/dihydropteroate synthase
VRAEWQPVFIQGRPASRVSIRTARSQYQELAVPLAGRVQGTNAACAVAAAEIVLGRRIAATRVRDALLALDWPGRMQAFPGAVTVILDGAHNADSLAKLTEAVRDYYPQERVVWLFACAADKDVRGMLRALAEAGAEVVFTRTDTPRAAEPEELAGDYAALCRALSPTRTHAGWHGQAQPGQERRSPTAGRAIGQAASMAKALRQARAALTPTGAGTGLPGRGLIVACGSLYLVGAMLEHPERFDLPH